MWLEIWEEIKKIKESVSSDIIWEEGVKNAKLKKTTEVKLAQRMLEQLSRALAQNIIQPWHGNTHLCVLGIIPEISGSVHTAYNTRVISILHSLRIIPAISQQCVYLHTGWSSELAIISLASWPPAFSSQPVLHKLVQPNPLPTFPNSAIIENMEVPTGQKLMTNSRLNIFL